MTSHPLFTRLPPDTAPNLRLDERSNADWTALSPLLDATEKAFAHLGHLAADGARKAADPDLSEVGREKRIAAAVAPAVAEVRATLDREVAKLEAYEARSRDEIRRAALRPDEQGEVGNLLREVRLDRTLRQLEGLDPGRVAKIVLEAAQRGDRLPLDAALASYVVELAAHTAESAERVWAAKVAPEASEKLAQAKRLVAAAKKVQALALNQAGRASLHHLPGGPELVRQLTGSGDGPRAA